MVFLTDRRTVNAVSEGERRRNRLSLSVCLTSMPAWRGDFFSITVKNHQIIDVKKSDTISSILGMNNSDWNLLGELVRKKLLDLSINYDIACSEHEELMRVSVMQGLDKNTYSFDTFCETDCISSDHLASLAEYCIKYILDNRREVE